MTQIIFGLNIVHKYSVCIKKREGFNSLTCARCAYLYECNVALNDNKQHFIDVFMLYNFNFTMLSLRNHEGVTVLSISFLTRIQNL